MRIEPEIQGASIVMVGGFNPQIFQPFWFSSHEIISYEDAESAVIGVIHPEIASFRVEGDFGLTVERERFMIDRSMAPLVRIADISCKVFGDLLPHTPIRQVGINRMVHFSVGTSEIRDRVGEKLAPRVAWGAWGELLSQGEGDKHGGLISLTMIQRELKDRAVGSISAKVEPSRLVGRGRTGIYVEINDHYELGGDIDGADNSIDIVRSRFDASIAYSDTIVDQIMSLAS